ncbi:MAG: hypothetical protein BA872_06355 [Desulfobacterales bacterium C00003060]|nr:MAG: hypothetical protein BA861_04370 [Desulfobacterales bacterium S3730MH5]OEU78683.1 MAG: hypothetical protein BA872_06355 [Desulfobacterales bacterium C00003060]OEU84364.1 MAG: hypothetical protein BA865_11135 [Desulfobacterales bacterium S5133MH4]
MLKKILGGILVVIWVFSPLVSIGQDIPPGKWWLMPRVSERLDLTNEEKRDLDDLFVNSRRKLIDLKGALERERFELENLIEKETLDETAVMDRFKNLEKARSNLAGERFRFLLQARKILGFERYQRLKNLFVEFRGKKHPGARRFNKDLPPHMP